DCGEVNGAIIILPENEDGIVEYSIDNGNTTQYNGTFSTLGTGNYTAYILDENGCSNTEEIFLNNADGPEIENIEVVNETCNSKDGSVSIQASSNNEPLTYELGN